MQLTFDFIDKPSKPVFGFSDYFLTYAEGLGIPMKRDTSTPIRLSEDDRIPFIPQYDVPQLALPFVEFQHLDSTGTLGSRIISYGFPHFEKAPNGGPWTINGKTSIFENMTSIATGSTITVRGKFQSIVYFEREADYLLFSLMV